jgi:hypothetical protein
MDINITGLKKAATKPLDRVGSYIDAYTKAKGARPESLHLSAKDYDRLESALRAENQELRGRTYKGVHLLYRK